MNPKASVVIPVYNAEKTVRRTVESTSGKFRHSQRELT